MKNLNKKICAIALAGMVVFGGVAASGLQSFAASGAASFQQKRVHDNQVIDEIEEMLEKLSLEKGCKKYEILAVYGSRERAEKELKEGKVSQIRSLSGYVPVVRQERRLRNILGRFVGEFDVFAIYYKGLSYIIGVEELVEEFAE